MFIFLFKYQSSEHCILWKNLSCVCKDCISLVFVLFTEPAQAFLVDRGRDVRRMDVPLVKRNSSICVPSPADLEVCTSLVKFKRRSQTLLVYRQTIISIHCIPQLS